eukprot:c17504_g1_i1 orf=3-431(-)
MYLLALLFVLKCLLVSGQGFLNTRPFIMRPLNLYGGRSTSFWSSLHSFLIWVLGSAKDCLLAGPRRNFDPSAYKISNLDVDERVILAFQKSLLVCCMLKYDSLRLSAGCGFPYYLNLQLECFHQFFKSEAVSSFRVPSLQLAL